MRNKTRLILNGANGLGIVALLAATFVLHLGSSHAASGQGTLQQLTPIGHGPLAVSGTSASSATGPSSLEYRADQAVDTQIPQSGSGLIRVPATDVPQPAPNALATGNPGFTGFNGLSHRDQRLAGTGAYVNTQHSLEPPDQALCVGQGFVVESINTAIRIFDTGGNPLSAPVALNQFFGFMPAINRTTGVLGDFTSDPKCLYDAANGGHFFLTLLRLDTVGRTHVDIAVTDTSDPRGTWNFYDIDTTDDGRNGTPSNANCPCLGDQPLIGADASGFYISTNEFPFTGFLNFTGFNGAQVYAMDKNALESGKAAGAVVHINTGAMPTPDVGGVWYSVQPATVPEGGAYAPNTEYFLSALQFGPSPLDNRIAVWALTGTSTLANRTPSVTLTDAVIDSEVYGQPPAASQAIGPLPLASSVSPQEKEEFLAGNDDRMNQVVFADGKLWSGVNTAIASNGATRVAIAYFIVSPSVAGGQVAGAVANQGYVSLQHDDVLFPSIGVNAAGKGVIGFTIAGPDFFPSTGYANIDAANGAGAVHIAGPGAAPEDGATGYPTIDGALGRVARWGDYSAAVAAVDGSIWLAAEYIPNAPRTFLANWGTFVSHVQP